MSRVNDVGGQQGFGAVDPDLAEIPDFHADWEARVFALQSGTEGHSEAQLAELVTREGLIGTAAV